MNSILSLAQALATPAKVLVVDDDDQILELVPMCLRKLDMTFVKVDNIDAAIEELHKEQFDLVILDLFMPGKTGLDFLDEVKRSLNPVPVVLITGYPDSEIAKIALDLGACGVIRKPFSCSSLEDDICRILELFKIKYKKPSDTTADELS